MNDLIQGNWYLLSGYAVKTRVPVEWRGKYPFRTAMLVNTFPEPIKAMYVRWYVVHEGKTRLEYDGDVLYSVFKHERSQKVLEFALDDRRQLLSVLPEQVLRIVEDSE